MVSGLIALVVVLVAATGTGFALRARQGRFRQVAPAPAPAPAPTADAAGDRLTADDLGAPLGERLTLVQFSTEYCTYCGPTRKLLTEVARDRPGVAFIEVDAAERMDLTRRLRIMSTPTVMLVDAAGSIASRAAGLPRKPELLAQVGAVLGKPATS